jgi:hypothetical protein
MHSVHGSMSTAIAIGTTTGIIAAGIITIGLSSFDRSRGGPFETYESFIKLRRQAVRGLPPFHAEVP